MSYEKYNHTVPTLARFTQSLIAQLSLLEVHPEAAASLAANRNLHREVWFRLARKPKADVAYELVNRPLDLEQLMVVAKDKRVTVRRTLVSNGLKGCTDEMGEYLISQPWFDSELATLWSCSKSVPAGLVKKVALIAGGNELVRHLADRTLFTDDEVKELLPTVNTVNVRLTLYQLMDLRPEIVAFAANAGASHPRLVEAAAGSRHLFEPELFATVLQTVERLGGQNHHSGEILISAMSNPNTPLDILDAMVERFPTRLVCLGSRYRPTTNATILHEARLRLAESRVALDRPWDSYPENEQAGMLKGVSLLGNLRYPSLRQLLYPDTKRQNVAVVPSNRSTESPDLNYVPSTPVGQSPIRLTTATVDRVTDLLDPFGNRAWFTFWSLIDTWQDNLASLVDTSITLAD
jgi:hypothetical protein